VPGSSLLLFNVPFWVCVDGDAVVVAPCLVGVEDEDVDGGFLPADDTSLSTPLGDGALAPIMASRRRFFLLDLAIVLVSVGYDTISIGNGDIGDRSG